MDFPKDHCNHPNVNTEWWYFAGIGKLDENEEINYHVSFFRKYIRPFKKQMLFAHWALTNGEHSEFLEKKDNNSFLDNSSLHVAIGDWDLSRFMHRYLIRLPEIYLVHLARKRPTIHHDRYYSITDMEIKGSIRGKVLHGTGWFDHEFFDFHSLQLITMKYNWFAIQLNKNIEIMLYMWPNESAKSLGSITFPSGECQTINAGDYCLAANDKNGWDLILPNYGIEVALRKVNTKKIKPKLGVPYIEGIFDVYNRVKIGQGFFEITGEN